MNFLCTLLLILSTLSHTPSYAKTPPNTPLKENSLMEAANNEPVTAPEFEGFEPLSITNYGYTKDYQLMKEGQFRYLGGARHMHELTLDPKGYFLYQGKKLDTYESWRWVMDPDGRIFVMPPTLNGEALHDIFHSSIVGDEWPFAGGTLKAKSGTIWKLTNGSGHFKPEDERLHAVIKYLNRTKAKIKSNALEIIKQEGPPPARLTFVNHAEYREDMLQDMSFEHSEIRLEKQPIVGKYIFKQYKRFLEGQHQLSLSDRSMYKITINLKGELIYQGKRLHTEMNQPFNWILHKNGSLYAAPKLNRIDHSSLVEHDWPVAAGELTAQHGTLLSINNKAHAFQFEGITLTEVTDYLKSKGVMMNIDTIETFFTFVLSQERLQNTSVNDFKMNFIRGIYTENQQNCSIQ